MKIKKQANENWKYVKVIENLKISDSDEKYLFKNLDNKI